MERRTVIDTAVGPLAVRVTGTGRPAVLWHSLFVDERSWDRLVARLGDSRLLVIITGPGHGASGDPGRRYTMTECADAARVVLDRVCVREPVDWVGNAWGGHVGAEFAATWPERCRSLAMLGSPVDPLSRAERARTYLLLAIYRLTGPSTVVVDGVTDVLLSAHTRAHDPEAVALVHDGLHRADRRMLRNAVLSISLGRASLADVLRQVTQPSLVVTGGDHHGFTPEQAEAAAALLRHGKVAIVPDCAYLVPLEAPDAVARVITEFWAAHDAVPTP